jgi:hypothetical protein
MRNGVRIIAGAALLLGCLTMNGALVQAETSADGNNVCLRSGYSHHSFDMPAAIPDGASSGITSGPIQIPDDGAAIEGLVLSLSITHPYTGDLEVSLAYDENNDGKVELTVPVELYRARTDGCTAREPHAYPDQLDGTYYFRDDSVSRPAAIAAATAGMQPDPLADPGTPSFSSFDGMRTGGSFYLHVVDTLPQKSGTVLGWSIYHRNGLAGSEVY